MAITADDYDALTTALGGICFALTRRLPVAERQPLLQDLVAMAHARNTAGDLRGETLLLDLAEAVASAMAGDPLKEKKALPRVCPGTREGQSRARGDDDARREEIGGLAQRPVVLSDGLGGRVLTTATTAPRGGRSTARTRPQRWRWSPGKSCGGLLHLSAYLWRLAKKSPVDVRPQIFARDYAPRLALDVDSQGLSACLAVVGNVTKVAGRRSAGRRKGVAGIRVER